MARERQPLRTIHGLDALANEIALQWQLRITHPGDTNRTLNHREELGLPTHPLAEWGKTVKYGDALTQLGHIQILADNPRRDKYVPPLVPSLLLATAYGNRQFSDRLLQYAYDSIWNPDGSPVDLSTSKQKATKLMADAYRQVALLISDTPQLQKFTDDDDLDTKMISLLLGRSRYPIQQQVQRIVDNKRRHALAPVIPAFVLSATGGLIMGSAIENTPGPLPSILDTGVITLESAIGGMVAANKLAGAVSKDKERNGCSAEFTGGVVGAAMGLGGSILSHSPEPNTLPYGILPALGTTAIGTVLLTRAFESGLDTIYGSAIDLGKQIEYWLGPEPTGTTQTRSGRIGELGRRSPHLVAQILPLRDRFYIEQTYKPWDQVNNVLFFLGLPSGHKNKPEKHVYDVLTLLAILPEVDFAQYEDDSPELGDQPEVTNPGIKAAGVKFVDHCKMYKSATDVCTALALEPVVQDKTVQWVQAKPSSVLTRITAAEWRRATAIVRKTPTEIDMLKSDRLPHPDTLKDFVEKRTVARKKAIGGLDNPDWFFKIGFAIPTAFRFAHPELSDPTKWPAWYDSTRFGQLKENPGNTGVLFGALMTYWQEMSELVGPVPPLNRFLQAVVYPSSSQETHPLYGLQHTFNEIVGSSLMVEAFTQGLLFGQTGQIKEQLKAITVKDVIDNIVSSPQHVMLYMSILSTLEFYKTVLIQTHNHLYYPHYMQEEGKSKEKIVKDHETAKWLEETVDASVKHMTELEGKIVGAMTQAFLDRKPDLFVSDQPDQDRLASASQNFVYFMYMLGLENPNWSAWVCNKVAKQLKASGATWEGKKRNMQALYAMAYVLQLYSATEDQLGDLNAYGIDAKAHLESVTKIQGHLLEVATDTIQTHLGFGPRDAQIPQTPETLEDAKSAVQVAAKVIPNDNIATLIREAQGQLTTAIAAQNALSSQPHLRLRAATLGVTMATLIQTLEEREGLKNIQTLQEARTTLLLADQALHLEIQHDKYGIHVTPAFFQALGQALGVLKQVIPPERMQATIESLIHGLANMTNGGST